MTQPHLSEDLKKELKEEKKEARKYLLIWPVTGFLAIGMIAFFWKIYYKPIDNTKLQPTQEISYPPNNPQASNGSTATPAPAENPPATTPVPTAAPAPTPTPTPASSGTYVVKDGDTLWTIASKNHSTVEAIQKANNLKGEDLQIGQKLIIP
jgi:cytoskeletal protein RodZ